MNLYAIFNFKLNAFSYYFVKLTFQFEIEEDIFKILWSKYFL